MQADFLTIVLIYSSLSFMMVIGLVLRWMPLLLLAGGGFLLLGVTLDTVVLSHEWVWSASAETCFDDAVTSQQVIYDPLSGDDFARLRDGWQTFGGEKVINADSLLSGVAVYGLNVTMAVEGSPDGIITFGVIDDSNVLVKSFGTISASQLTSSPATYQRVSSVSYTLSVNDTIGVMYSAGDVDNHLKVYVKSGNPYDGFNSVADNAGSIYDYTYIINTSIGTQCDTTNIGSWQETTESFPSEFRAITGLGGSLVILAAAIMFMRN